MVASVAFTIKTATFRMPSLMFGQDHGLSMGSDQIDLSLRSLQVCIDILCALSEKWLSDGDLVRLKRLSIV